MKTLHVSLQVKDMAQSVDFYSALFGAEPGIRKRDYAKWALSDPSVNFSISPGGSAGVNHLGIEVPSQEELHKLYENMHKAEGEIREEGHTVCCYAQSEKSWIKDPQGVEWEVFHTYGESSVKKTENEPCCEETCHCGS